MDIKYIVSMLCGFLLLASLNANSAIIDNGMYTTDTSNGLDWLDLTATSGRAYSDITSEFGAGGEFEGWRHATLTEIIGYLGSFGGDGNYNGWSTANNGVYDAITPYWGELGNRETHFIYLQSGVGGNIRTADINDQSQINSSSGQDVALTGDYINIYGFLGNVNITGSTTGHALVRGTSVVPVPAAAWLFGSGLLGLIGIARRKKI